MRISDWSSDVCSSDLFYGFLGALRDGADFVKVDKVMEGFGWPMGPAYLQDVVGIDTSHHVGDVLAEGYPDRMKNTTGEKTALDIMYEQKSFGQKNGINRKSAGKGKSVSVS